MSELYSIAGVIVLLGIVYFVMRSLTKRRHDRSRERRYFKKDR